MQLLLPPDSTPEAAIEWLKRLVREFGLGFHPDTPAEDYSTPSGAPSFSPDECTSLNRSIDLLFSILGDERPYAICADEASVMLAEFVGAKPPLEFHDPAFQRGLLRDGCREEIIQWLCWNDPNGCYTDSDSAAEGRSPLSIDDARRIMTDQVGRDHPV